MVELWFPGWLPARGALPGTTRVYCLPYAGGTAGAFRTWLEPAAERGMDLVPLELPGHGGRWREQPFTTMPSLVEALCDALIADSATTDDGRFALFGHSMGALVGFAVALELQRRHGADSPVGHVFASGAQVPGTPVPEPLHLLGDEQLVQHLGRLGGTPPEVLGNAELMEFALPTLRADLAVIEDWRPGAVRRVRAPLTAFAGTDDLLATPGEAARWSECTSASFASFGYGGGHFFVHEHAESVLSAMAERVRAAGPGHRSPVYSLTGADA